MWLGPLPQPRNAFSIHPVTAAQPQLDTTLQFHFNKLLSPLAITKNHQKLQKIQTKLDLS